MLTNKALSLFKKSTQLLFEQTCWHCKGSCDEGTLCPACLDHFELIDAKKRCPICFAPHENKGTCGKCTFGSLRLAAAFEYEGPSVSLLHHFKYGGHFALARLMASFLVVQLAKLDWEMPDCLIPVPQTLSHRLLRGYNPSLLIAKEMGKLLERPVYNILKRKEGRVPQSALDRHHRLTLSPENFALKKRRDLSDQTLLLIDDVITTGATFAACSQALMETFPARRYGLALCINSHAEQDS